MCFSSYTADHFGRRGGLSDPDHTLIMSSRERSRSRSGRRAKSTPRKVEKVEKKIVKEVKKTERAAAQVQRAERKVTHTAEALVRKDKKKRSKNTRERAKTEERRMVVHERQKGVHAKPHSGRINDPLLAAYLMPDRLIPGLLDASIHVPPVPAVGEPLFPLVMRSQTTATLSSPLNPGVLPTETTYDIHTEAGWLCLVPTNELAFIGAPVGAAPLLDATISGDSYTVDVSLTPLPALFWMAPSFQIWTSTTPGAHGGTPVAPLYDRANFIMPMACPDNYSWNLDSAPNNTRHPLSWVPIPPQDGSELYAQFVSGTATPAEGPTGYPPPIPTIIGPGYCRVTYNWNASTSAIYRWATIRAGNSSFLAGASNIGIVADVSPMAYDCFSIMAAFLDLPAITPVGITPQTMYMWPLDAIMQVANNVSDVMTTTPEEPGFCLLQAPPCDPHVRQLPTMDGWAMFESQQAQAAADQALTRVQQIERRLRAYETGKPLGASEIDFSTSDNVLPAADQSLVTLCRFTNTSQALALGTAGNTAAPPITFNLETYGVLYASVLTQSGLPRLSRPFSTRTAGIFAAICGNNSEVGAPPNSFWSDVWGGIKSFGAGVLSFGTEVAKEAGKAALFAAL
jgi:hypothetical protein